MILFNLLISLIIIKHISLKFKYNVHPYSNSLSFKTLFLIYSSSWLVKDAKSRLENVSFLKSVTPKSSFFFSKSNDIFAVIFSRFYIAISNVQCPAKVKVQPALLFSFFVRNSSINKLKNMKLSEHIYYEMINWVLHYCSFGNSL